jgi:hypothetical protein
VNAVSGDPACKRMQGRPRVVGARVLKLAPRQERATQRHSQDKDGGDGAVSNTGQLRRTRQNDEQPSPLVLLWIPYLRFCSFLCGYSAVVAAMGDADGMDDLVVSLIWLCL